MAQYNLSSSQSDRINFSEWARQDARDAFLYHDAADFERIREQLAVDPITRMVDDAAVVGYVAQQRFETYRIESNDAGSPRWVDDEGEAYARYRQAFIETYLDELRETAGAALWEALDRHGEHEPDEDE